MKTKEAALRQVEAKIPKRARAMFVRTLKREIAAIAASIQRRVESQAHFPSPGHREQLLKAPHARICQIMGEFASKVQASGAAPESAQASLRFLKELSHLKALIERKAQVASALEQDGGRMSAYDLLILMFSSVLKAMYREEWKAFGEESASPACPATDDLSMATTI
jgi:hypothetical protein